jgi:uncharacterized protein (DUF697 family)
MDIEEKVKKSVKANSIIKNHMIWSMGAGFIPVPIVDFFAVSAIQLDMIRQLTGLYEIDFKETQGKAFITALTGGMVAQLGARAVKFVPGIGSVLGGVTLAVLSGASTYALGEVFKTHFETGGTFLDFDPSRLKKFYDDQFEKGKDLARKVKEEQDNQDKSNGEYNTVDEDPISKLKELAKLKSDGVISEEEFEVLKKKVIGSE